MIRVKLRDDNKNYIFKFFYVRDFKYSPRSKVYESWIVTAWEEDNEEQTQRTGWMTRNPRNGYIVDIFPNMEFFDPFLIETRLYKEALKMFRKKKRVK